MSVTRRWISAERVEAPRALVRELGLSPLVARLLCMRGVDTVEQARDYLEAPLINMHDPELLPAMEAAGERLCAAARAGELILLFGDYDVDGITGCAILARVLKALGATVEVYIPNRFRDGYGLNVASLERLREADGVDPRVVVTIDNGIVAFEAAKHLAGRGVDLIILDHHTMEPGPPPRAHAVVHPKLDDSRYPNRELCGAGVAFKAAWATARRFHGGGRVPPALRALLLESMALVAMGTIADVMPLAGENRTLVKRGLEALASKPSIGLGALIAVAGVRGEPAARDVSYRLAPHINAAGRLGEGRRAFDLLLIEDPDRARELAEELARENDARREIEVELSEQACAQVLEVYGEEPPVAGLVVAAEGWHEGVVGIVASRLVERFDRPALVLAVLDGGERAKGSGRSAHRVDLKGALDDCRELLDGYGGHAAAVGLSLASESLGALRVAFARACARQLGLPEEGEVELPAPELKIDAEVELSEVDDLLVAQLARLEPHGMGNRRPLFAARAELAGAPRVMGAQGQHLSFMVREGRRRLRAVMWGGGEHFDALRARIEAPVVARRPLRFAFRPKYNDFRGRRSIELQVEDIDLSS